MSSFPPDDEILAELGRGTTGIVYKARDTHLDRVVALKTLLPSRAANLDARRRFLREARAVASLAGKDEPNIVQLHAVGENYGQPFQLREYVEGQTLDEAVRSHSLGLAEGLVIVRTVAKVVHRVHQRGLVHRNLHPSNVLLASDGTAKLCGFGRVGMLAPSNLPMDLEALQQMLRWLSETVGETLPASAAKLLEAGSIASADAFAEALVATV
jgi:serine/threonine protein kinase